MYSKVQNKLLKYLHKNRSHPINETKLKQMFNLDKHSNAFKMLKDDKLVITDSSQLHQPPK